MVFCSNCGTQGSGKFCQKCGDQLSSSPKSYSAPKSSPPPLQLGNRATPVVNSIVQGRASGPQSTTTYDSPSVNYGVTKPGLPPPTYGKQPSWAYAEQHKNHHLQYKDGQFRELHK